MKTWLGMVVSVGMILGYNPAAKVMAQAQAAPAQNSIETVDLQYQKDLIAAHKARITRLAELAATQPKDESQKTYEELFRFAIAMGLYSDCEPIAERVLTAPDTSTTVTTFAHMVNIIAEADRGAYDESLASLTKAVQGGDNDGKANPGNKALRSLPQPAKLHIISSYIQKLIQAGRFDLAKKAATLIRDNAVDPAVKALAVHRLEQLELIGKAAPAFKVTDLDGKPISLEAHKGEVVLLVFWASWCIQNSQEVAQFEEAIAQFGGKGLKVIGVNVDALQDGGVATETVLPNVRRFILDYNIRWPNIMNGTGANDIAKAFGVTEIPTNILIGRDGTILHEDLHRKNFKDVIGKALAK